MMRLRYLVRLLFNVTRFGSASGALWLLPVVVGLLLFFLMVITTQATVPYVVYTFF